MKHFRKKHFVFVCDQSRKLIEVPANSFLDACEVLYDKFRDFTFTLVTIL